MTVPEANSLGSDSGPLNEIIVGLDGTMQVQDQDFSPTAQCTTDQICGEIYPTESLTDSCSADAAPWVAIGNDGVRAQTWATPPSTAMARRLSGHQPRRHLHPRLPNNLGNRDDRRSLHRRDHPAADDNAQPR